MNIIFVLVIFAIYSFVFALSRRPWVPWALCAFTFASTAAALVSYTDIAVPRQEQTYGIGSTLNKGITNDEQLKSARDPAGKILQSR